jgi:hypothetical protein
VRVTSSTVPPGGDDLASIFSFVSGSRSLTFTTTSTTLAEATAQAIEPVRGNGNFTWITVELAADTVSESCQSYGLTRCYLGPAEDP